MNQTILVYIFIIIAVIVARVVFSNKPHTKKEYTYTGKKFFLSPVEHKFYDALMNVVGAEYRIFAQVHLPTIVENKVIGQSWRGAFRHIDEKSVDFVLCDKVNISPQLVIELDDSSHLRPDRKARDIEVERILKVAGLALLRLPVQSEFNSVMLQSQIRQALSSHPVQASPQQ